MKVSTEFAFHSLRKPLSVRKRIHYDHKHPWFIIKRKSFIDLLNNQQPSIDLSTSNVSGFVPHWVEEENVEAHTVEDRKERRKWIPTEDGVLISAWLNTSKDPVVRNEQKAIAFWKRIEAYVGASPKLAGAYDAATKQKLSGQNENDVMKMAHEIFYNDHKVKFTLEHACVKEGSQMTKAHNHQALRQERMIKRPAGVKATNAKAKRSVSKPTMEEEGREIQSMWKIRQKDFALKEKLNKQKLLDKLIAKTEPLTELEIALKNKLITDMLAS
ncbi:glutathione S-transferase T3-like [Brassica napus]|uniref:glutathione S-transferase T3-like n=1 Tax=Brassica napus TaxID=3708 RepID=UPI002078E8FC|nr:glutathione S-transferase T3-like [Brassica napus]